MVQLHPTNTERRSVTFTLPKSILAQSAGLVGDFVDESWNPCGHPMIQDTDGRWWITLELEAGRAYEFRYWVNGSEWHNDDGCPQVPNPYGSHNSVLWVPVEPSPPKVLEPKPLLALVTAGQND